MNRTLNKTVEQGLKLYLERMIFIGRTFKAYLDIFSLSEETLNGKNTQLSIRGLFIRSQAPLKII